MTQRVWPRGVCGCPVPRPVLLGKEEASFIFPKKHVRAESEAQSCLGGRDGPGVMGYSEIARFPSRRAAWRTGWPSSRQMFVNLKEKGCPTQMTQLGYASCR
ncbi:hypothetical protein E2C01_042710 [Portunus trituberculatus]|uniref:Uncharacterized protein n=1 Tax=Portunus trituberculatus TaxID=210409 RepID=A0A5B7FVD8_PORTR|nr:hypothetical protein [Portunus trituberculatus]